LRRKLPLAKAAFISWFGRRMLKDLKTAGLASNNGFAGIYNFRDSAKYPMLLSRFVAALPETNGILVVHPGLDEPWREEEFESLTSFDFAPGQPNRFRH
jgi:hypothetical protein